ncbi:YrhB domain-containing protein [Streptomyces sp. NPDC041068]|uniref:YrhB domain-containing protein n=1 Tax=Streptomyces sp. NPDC041068 TaxID=3155130 RepID=UPI0033D6484B
MLPLTVLLILTVTAAAMGNAARVIDREAAVRIVEEELEGPNQAWAALGVDSMRMAVAGVEEHELVWIVYWQTEEYVRTGKRDVMVAGNAPYLVDRVDGGLHQIGIPSAISGEWEADYRSRIRGLPVRTAVDDLHDELRGIVTAGGRMQAVRTLRTRVPVLPPGQCIEYVSALLDGDAPAHLVSIALEQLVEPIDPMDTAITIRQGDPGRS